jgi:hypothetical protein
MRTPNPCDHPAPRGHPHDEGVVPTRISEAVEPTDEPAVPFDLVVRPDDQREEALLLVLPQVDHAQVQPAGGIIGVVMVEEVGGRWRARPKHEATQEDQHHANSFWRLARRSLIPPTGSLLTTASSTPYGERGMVVEAPGPFLQRQSVLEEKASPGASPSSPAAAPGTAPHGEPAV